MMNLFVDRDDAPRTKNGRFASRNCPVCGYGRVQFEKDSCGGGGSWRCDGLRDPERDDQELIACEYSISGGEIYAPNLEARKPKQKTRIEL